MVGLMYFCKLKELGFGGVYDEFLRAESPMRPTIQIGEQNLK